MTVDAGVLEYTLSGLLDDWWYGVQVRAHNATGAGAWSDVTPTRTADHGNDRATAVSLPLDSTVLGYISSGSDVDYFKIEPVSAATEIHVRTYSGIDTVGQLLDSNGNVLTQNNDGNIDFFRNPKDFSPRLRAHRRQHVLHQGQRSRERDRILFSANRDDD